MSKVIGVLLIIAAFFVAAYVSLWVFLVGGIVNIADGFKATPTNKVLITIGVVKAGFCWEAAGVITFFVISGIGAAFLGWGDRYGTKHLSGGSNRQVERNWERTMRSYLDADAEEVE